MERELPNENRGSLTLVLGLTTLVLLVPCLAAIGLRSLGLITSPVLLILIPVVISVGISHAISEFWKRRRVGSPVLVEELMLWGWLRSRRFDRLLARSEEFVGPGAGAGLTPKQRAKELERLAGALEARDPRTHGHSKRVARHATAIARRMNLGPEEVARIRTAALLHDIGKIEVPRQILEKPDELTDQEFAQIKEHPAAGARLVAGLGDDELVAIVRHHHERIDGAGYPDGISRGQIPVGARIIAVADTFDALTSARTYSQPCSHEEALVVIREEAGAHLDARAVRAFDSRFSTRRPVALVAVVLGLGRQAGQSMISFGTGASQVAAVGAAAAVIGAAPVVEKNIQNDSPEQPAIVREAESFTGEVSALVSGAVAVGASTSKNPVAGSIDTVRPGKNEKPGNNEDSSSGGGSSDGGGDEGGGSSGSDPGGSGGGGSTDGGTGTGGSTGSGSTPVTNEAVKQVTEAVQKPVQQVTEKVTEAIPTLPGNDPVSQGVNDTVNGVKDTIGKLTGKP